MGRILGLLVTLALVACGGIAAALGFVPANGADAPLGPPVDLLGLEQVAGVAGGTTVVGGVILWLLRNYTRAKAMKKQ